MVMEHESPNGVTQLDPQKVKPRLPSLDLQEPAEPVFPPDNDWLAPGPSSLADHPLLRVADGTASQGERSASG